MKKLRYMYLLIIIIPMALLAFLINSSFSQLMHHNIQMQLSSDKQFVNELKSEIDERYFHVKQDAVFFALFLSSNLDGINDKTYKGQKEIKILTEKLFSEFHDANNMYKQITYVDEQGKQVAAIDGKGNSVPLTTTEKINEKFFRGAKERKLGESYTIFDGSMLYISSPVYDKTGTFSGIVMLTMEKDVLLQRLITNTKHNELLFIDSSGENILTSGQHAEGNFKSSYSEKLLQEITANKSGYAETGDETLLTYNRIQVDEEEWYLIIHRSRAEITAHTSELQVQRMKFLITTFIAVLIAIALWAVSYRKAAETEALESQKDKLENLNNQLINKQYELEEQNSIVEELNAQLEEEVIRTQQQKDILQAITHSLEEGIAMINAEDKSLFIDRAWRELFGYSSEDNPTYMHTDTFIESIMDCISSPNETAALLKSLLTNYNDIYTTELEQIKPVHRYLGLYSAPCIAADGNAIGRIFVCNDITHRKEVDRLKSELISTVSHELRTPMSSIMGFSELMLTRKLSPDRTREYIEIIHSESCRLTALIDDFLDIQRMESGKQQFDKQRISFDLIVKGALNLFQNIEGKHRIIYDVGETCLPYVFCDKDKIIQVMSNLLSNAIKYSPAGGDIIINVSTAADMLKVGVNDFGLGIPEEAKDKLFTKFFRIDNDDRRKIGGTGLGLAICKNIIQAHGGNIWAESVYGKGSTFYFTLPIVKKRQTEAADISDMKKTSAGNCILIVEVDNNLVKLMKAVLADDGFEVYAVNNGEEALKLINNVNFKLIILDIKLAGNLSGWDVLKALKGNSKTVDLPVIISSIRESENQIPADMIDEHLVKPFEPRQLLNEVHKVINKGLEETDDE